MRIFLKTARKHFIWLWSTDEYDVRGAFNNNQICAKCPSPLEHFVHYKNFLLIKNHILLQVTNCSETSKCSFTGTIQNGI